ncbi:MAG: PC4/YdbC family ssDNA-binding protein [Rhodospirillales bacterium]|jgi:hypothetical protein|nr:PC4/YdbC family ssDNA-binding protein [Rhodospirillales bacterium]
MEKTVATFRKGTREEIRIALSEFQANGKTFDMISARVFFDDGNEYRPGRNGLNLKIELLPELIAALTEAETEARAAGLIPGADS